MSGAEPAPVSNTRDGAAPPAPISPSAPCDAPGNGRRAAPPRDNISIAFKSSQYPTPYADQSVPGDRPGHRERHLGRAYAPQPLTHSQLNNALVVPYVEGVSATDCGEGTAASVNPATMYVLNVKNNGKRHFDQSRGAEEPWVPAKRYVPPPGTTASEAVYGSIDKPHRRGLGVYNLDTGAGLHPHASAALERRRVKGEADLRGGRGKAMVDKPPDHSVFHLGLAHTVFGSAGEAGDANEGNSNSGAATQPTATMETVVEAAPGELSSSSSPPSPQPATASSEPQAARYVNNGFVFSSNYVDETNGIAGTPYVGSVRPQQEAPDYLVGRQVLSEWRATQRTRGATAKLNDDVDAVRRLPDW